MILKKKNFICENTLKKLCCHDKLKDSFLVSFQELKISFLL